MDQRDQNGAGHAAGHTYEPKPGEAYMSEAQVAYFREVLRSRKQELLRDVEQARHHMQGESVNLPDQHDRAAQSEEVELGLRKCAREGKLIQKIDEALERLEHDAYGYCDACGVEIGWGRLCARPTADLCIDCKTLEEKREKLRGKS